MKERMVGIHSCYDCKHRNNFLHKECFDCKTYYSTFTRKQSTPTYWESGENASAEEDGK